MPATTPPTITALPAPPDPANRSTFNALAYPWSTAQQTLATQMGALASNVYSNAQAAEAAATAADLDAAAAAADKIAAAGSATTATTQNGQAQTAATTATTQAGIASTQRGLAETAATTATTQAGAATTALASAAAITLGVASGHPTLRPTLNLNFAQARSVDPRITFTRASTATRTNSRGLIESVATGTPRIDFDPITLACRGLLVEESRTNRLEHSSLFEGTGWFSSSVFMYRYAAQAPDGSLTAVKVVPFATSAQHLLGTSIANVSGSVEVFSVFAKAAGVTSVCISTYGQGDVVFNLLAGTHTLATPTATFLNAWINSVGNGWYRCAVAIYRTSSTPNHYIGVPSTGVTTGDGVNGVLLWGPQLEAGAFPTSYIPSTVTHTGRSSTATFIGSNGLIQTAASGAARYSYNPLNLSAAPALLLEAAATNLLTYSEQFDNAAWTKGNLTAGANAVAAPDGALTAESFVENTVASQYHYSSQSVSKAASPLQYTASVYVKAMPSTRQFEVQGISGSSGAVVRVNPADGSIVGGAAVWGSFAGASAYVQPAGNGWYRIALTFTTDSTTSIAQQISLHNGTTNVYTGDGVSGVYVWGAQLEAGSFPTSYIPTTASQVTRAADTSTSAATTRAGDAAGMTGTNFTSWFRQSEGTFACEFSVYAPATTGFDRVWEVSDSQWTPQNNLLLLKQNGSGAYYTTINSGALVQALHATTVISPNTFTRTAFGYAANNVNLAYNGVLGVNNTSAALPLTAQNKLAIGGDFSGTSLINGHIRSLRYYPKRLTNTELQTLTQE